MSLLPEYTQSMLPTGLELVPLLSTSYSSNMILSGPEREVFIFVDLSAALIGKKAAYLPIFFTGHKRLEGIQVQWTSKITE